MIIPLGIGMSIIGNIRAWNGVTIPLLLFGYNTYALIGIKPKFLKYPKKLNEA
jgi:hypothetical protein